MSNTIQIKRRINGSAGSPSATGAKEGELAINAPNAAGSTDKPTLFFFDGTGWRTVNPDVTISTQSIDLGTTGADIGAAYTTWAGTTTNKLTGNVVIATWGTPAQAYVLTNPAAPGTAASWTSLGGAVDFASAAEIHAGTDTTKAINSAILRGEAVDTPDATPANDADKLIRLGSTGKIAAGFLPAQNTQILGAKDITAAMPTGASAYTPAKGDMFYSNKAGAIDASWTGLTGNVQSGDMIIYDGTNFHLIPNEVDLSAYLALTGGTMGDGASITFDTATAAAGTGGAATQTVIDGAGGSADNLVIDGGTY